MKNAPRQQQSHRIFLAWVETDSNQANETHHKSIWWLLFFFRSRFHVSNGLNVMQNENRICIVENVQSQSDETCLRNNEVDEWPNQIFDKLIISAKIESRSKCAQPCTTWHFASHIFFGQLSARTKSGINKWIFVCFKWNEDSLSQTGFNKLQQHGIS